MNSEWTMNEVKACYVVRGVDSKGGPWMTRELIWPSCDSAGHRRYIRLLCQRKAERMNQAGATVAVSYQELDSNGLWKDATEP